MTLKFEIYKNIPIPKTFRISKDWYFSCSSVSVKTYYITFWSSWNEVSPLPSPKRDCYLGNSFLYFLYESNFKQGRFWQCPWQTPYRSDISSWRERSPHSRRDVHRAEKQWTRSSPYRSYTESDPSGLCSLVSGKSVLFKNKILILHI